MDTYNSTSVLLITIMPHVIPVENGIPAAKDTSNDMLVDTDGMDDIEFMEGIDDILDKILGYSAVDSAGDDSGFMQGIADILDLPPDLLPLPDSAA